MTQTQTDPRSQLRLAHLMLTGRERYTQPDEPIRLVVAACAQRSAEAMLYHAALAARGHGRSQNLDEAFELVTQAASLGDTRAKGQLMALGPTLDRNAWFAPVQAVQHHQAPRVFSVENFLPKSACAWLIKQAKKNLVRAPVQTAAQGGAFSVDNARTNSAAGSSHLQPDLVVQLANMRIAAAIGLPLANQEPTNFLHYARGQQYGRHFDFITQEEEQGFARELAAIGQRVATVLVYLNEEYEGGETEFPLLDWRFKGKTGDALIFWNLSAQGEREMNSLHAGTPVTKGEKWLLSKWVRQRPVPLI